MLNQFRERLEQNQSTVTTRIWSTWPRFIEAAASTGSFDYLEFVAEYSPFTLNDLENFARTCELYRVGSMIKVDFQNRFYVAQKAMAAGFQAVHILLGIRKRGNNLFGVHTINPALDRIDAFFTGAKR